MSCSFPVRNVSYNSLKTEHLPHTNCNMRDLRFSLCDNHPTELCRQHAPLNSRHTSTRLHGVTFWNKLILPSHVPEPCTEPAQYSLCLNSHYETPICVLHSMKCSSKNTVGFTLLCVLMTNSYIKLDAINAKTLDHNLILQQSLLRNSLYAYQFCSLRSKFSPMNVYSMMLQ